MKDWFSLQELSAARLPTLPQSEKSLDNLVRARGWRNDPARARKVAGRTKPFWEYHISLLPDQAQVRLRLLHQPPANDDHSRHAHQRKALWAHYERLPSHQKAVARQRLDAIIHEQELRQAGLTAHAAIAMACRKADCGKSQLYAWMGAIEGYDREDWLAALAPHFAGTAHRSDCHADAWDFLKSDFLRSEAPKFSPCYRRLLTIAKKKGWAPIPQERALRRRLDAEVPKAVQLLARKGGDRAKGLYPAQRRSRAHLYALQMVNMDGHKIDVFVAVPWSAQPVRMHLICIQDLYSGKILAWRLSDSENKETVRLVIGDVVENFGLFDDIYLDNGRSFASKWITGGVPNRFRFKVRDEDPTGLLPMLGVKPHFTTPYSGQSKPIERAFLDLTEAIAKHPFCAGAYTGNRPDAKPENYGSRAIPLAGFQDHVAREIAAHNAQPGRSAANCQGRSFDQTFADSINDPANVPRQATRAQRALWLLASEAIRAQKGSGEIHFHGNRYWAKELNQHAGKKLVIRFDPDALQTRVLVYGLDDRLVCEAACIADTGFDDLEAARQHARRRRDYQKAVAAERDAHRVLTAAQLADLLIEGEKPQAALPPARTKVARLVPAAAIKPDTISRDDAEDSFGRAMARIGNPVVAFPANPTGNIPVNPASGAQLPPSNEFGSRKSIFNQGT